MKQLIYTFSAILLLLAGLLTTWWYQSYQRDRAQLRDRVERDLEDLLVSTVFRRAVPFFMPRGPVWEGGSAHERVARNEAYLEYSMTSLRRHTRVILESGENFPEGGLQSVTVMTNPLGRDTQTLTFHFQDDNFTLGRMPRAVMDSIGHLHGVVLRPRRFGSFGSGEHPPPMCVKTSLINEGPRRDPTYYRITGYRKTLVLGLLPEILFGLLLFGATGFAFATAYRNLFEQNRQLQLKDALVANVAHELKTPIATVSVALEALNVFGVDADPARRREYLAIGQAELQRLEQMADRAIDSLQAGELSQRIQRERTDLAAAVRQAWRGLSLRYNLTDDRLTLTTDGDPHAAVDPHYWHHLVYNLLDNACKYGGDPPAIAVTVRRQPDATVLTVADNGPGVPAAERERVFERFYRIHKPGEGHKVKGHGLGLTFVRQVARAHGGSVALEGTPGGGARFTVTLPHHRTDGPA